MKTRICCLLLREVHPCDQILSYHVVYPVYRDRLLWKEKSHMIRTKLLLLVHALWSYLNLAPSICGPASGRTTTSRSPCALSVAKVGPSSLTSHLYLPVLSRLSFDRTTWFMLDLDMSTLTPELLWTKIGLAFPGK